MAGAAREESKVTFAYGMCMACLKQDLVALAQDTGADEVTDDGFDAVIGLAIPGAVLARVVARSACRLRRRPAERY